MALQISDKVQSTNFYSTMTVLTGFTTGIAIILNRMFYSIIDIGSRSHVGGAESGVESEAGDSGAGVGGETPTSLRKDTEGTAAGPTPPNSHTHKLKTPPPTTTPSRGRGGGEGEGGRREGAWLETGTTLTARLSPLRRLAGTEEGEERGEGSVGEEEEDGGMEEGERSGEVSNSNSSSGRTHTTSTSTNTSQTSPVTTSSSSPHRYI